MKRGMIWILFLALMGPMAVFAAERNTGNIAIVSDDRAVTGQVGFRMGRSSILSILRWERNVPRSD